MPMTVRFAVCRCDPRQVPRVGRGRALRDAGNRNQRRGAKARIPHRRPRQRARRQGRQPARRTRPHDPPARLPPGQGPDADPAPALWPLGARRSAGEHGPGQLGRYDPRAQSAPGAAAEIRHRLVQRGGRSRIQDAGRGPPGDPGDQFWRSRHRAPDRRGAGGKHRGCDRSGSPSSSAKPKPVERPAENEDILVVDVDGKVGDEEIPGAGGKDRQIVLGSAGFIPGFEEQLVGAAAGEHREVRVTFPEDYAASHLAGKEAVFSVDVKEVRQRLPAVDRRRAWRSRSGSKTWPSCARRCGSRWSAITRWPRACG